MPLKLEQRIIAFITGKEEEAAPRLCQPVSIQSWGDIQGEKTGGDFGLIISVFSTVLKKEEKAVYILRSEILMVYGQYVHVGIEFLNFTCGIPEVPNQPTHDSLKEFLMLTLRKANACSWNWFSLDFLFIWAVTDSNVLAKRGR